MPATSSFTKTKPPQHRSTQTKRKQWGAFTEEAPELREELKPRDFISAKIKLEHLTKLQAHKFPRIKRMITIDNPVVTQTVEVMNQTEVIQSLIDTYTSNNTGNPCVLMPQIDFPPDTTAPLVRDDKFIKPLWYMPPIDTAFTRGVPLRLPTISKPVVLEAMRKSISGLLRLKGFNEATDSALIMLTDGVDEFYKCFMASLNDVLVNESRDIHRQLDVATIERGYFQMCHSSLTSLHNYHKNEIVLRNKTERHEFQAIFHEYDRLMQQSQNLHKNNIKQEDEYIGVVDFAGTSGSIEGGESHVIQHTDHGEGVVKIVNFLDGDLISNPASFQTNFEANTNNRSLVGKTVTTLSSTDEHSAHPNIRFGPQSQ